MILALESSCDETALAVFDPARGLAGEWLNSQMALHELHGGVVPDLAAREHLRHVAPLLESSRSLWNDGQIGRIAVTRGPGLAACLAIGIAGAKALALALKAPIVGINHLRAHVWSPFIPLHAKSPGDFEADLDRHLPHLGLLASGGHTLLCAIGADRRLIELSSTRDDAAGEALDKGAKLLGLGYPGGPLIERLAANGRPDAFDFPRGIAQKDSLEFSFSGLKTSLRYRLEKMPAEEVRNRLADLCASYQAAVVDSLARKVGAALEQGSFRSLGLSGGVANNASLRRALSAIAERGRVPFLCALPQHCGDNAGMIAFAAWADQAGAAPDGLGLTIEPSLALTCTRA